jgi:DNA repair exonuclease SbcCD ATPase subunit
MALLKDRVQELSRNVNVASQLQRMERRKLAEVQGDLSKAQANTKQLEQVQSLFAQMTQILIDNEIKPIQSFVTNGLNKVFPDRDLAFKINQKEVSSGVQYEFVLQDGDIEANISDNFGGSVLEVSSLMLRLFVIKRLNKAQFIAFDEFFTGIDARHRINLIQCLKNLCSELGFDIFLITHQEDFVNGADLVLQAYRTLDGLKIKEFTNAVEDGSDSET